MHSSSQPDAGLDFVRQAEALLRSLAGVVHARIQTGPGGIDSIHVVAADDDAATAMAGHVRSALLAGLATPVVPARIHVRTEAATDARTAPRPDASRDPDDRRGDVAVADPDTAGARDRLRLFNGAPDDESGSAPAPRGRAAPAGPATGLLAESRAHVLLARLVAIDVRRPADGRVLCRVSIAWNGQVHRAEALAVDLPGAAAQAAAQAAVRALAAAGLEGLELSGLREVEIAGKDYVLVALRREDGTTVRHRSGSALMFGTPERSAAEAAVDAANELI